MPRTLRSATTTATTVLMAMMVIEGACSSGDGDGDGDLDADAALDADEDTIGDAEPDADTDSIDASADADDPSDADHLDATTLDADEDREIVLPPGPYVHVRAVDGADEPSAGSADRPFRTIQYAIDSAAPPVSVLVAAGSYEESITLREGVSLYGAFSETDWNDRDLYDRENPAYACAIEASLNIAIVGGVGITSATVVEGLLISGGYDRHDHHSYGIYLYDGASPTIRHNTIDGGTGDTYGNGIALMGSSAQIIGNVIRGGDAEIVYGIRSGNESTPLIASNVIIGETAVDVSYGMLLNNSSPRIMNNTIDGGSGISEAHGIFLFGSCAPAIENNLVFTSGGAQRIGIFEFAFLSSPTTLRNNDIFDCPDGLYRDDDSSPHELTDIESVNGLAGVTSENNISVSPELAADDVHLQPSSPVAVRRGGRDLSGEGFDIDVDGQPRTALWSLGADELDSD